MKHIRQHVAQRKVVWANEIVVTTINLRKAASKGNCWNPCDINLFELKTDHMLNKLLHTKSDVRYTDHVKLEYYYKGKGSWRWRDWNNYTTISLIQRWFIPKLFEIRSLVLEKTSLPLEYFPSIGLNFTALHRQWWHLHMSERLTSRT
jgi:hypothetical protein